MSPNAAVCGLNIVDGNLEMYTTQLCKIFIVTTQLSFYRFAANAWAPDFHFSWIFSY